MLGFSFTSHNINAYLFTQDQARDIKKATAAVYVGSTALRAARVEGIHLKNVQLYSGLLHDVLASALEEHDYVVKLATVLSQSEIPELSFHISEWYNEPTEDNKDFMTVQSKFSALFLSKALAKEFSEILADKFINNKIQDMYPRRVTRALTYAISHALILALETTIQEWLYSNKGDKIACVAIAKDTFVTSLGAILIANLAYQAAGEALAHYLIEPKEVFA